MVRHFNPHSARCTANREAFQLGALPAGAQRFIASIAHTMLMQRIFYGCNECNECNPCNPCNESERFVAFIAHTMLMQRIFYGCNECNECNPCNECALPCQAASLPRLPCWHSP